MRYVVGLLLLAACSNSTAPTSANFVARNDWTEGARFVLTGAAGDTMFDHVVAPGTQQCRTFHESGIAAKVYLSADTLTASPFYSADNYADMLIVKNDSTLIQTRTTNTGC